MDGLTMQLLIFFGFIFLVYGFAGLCSGLLDLNAVFFFHILNQLRVLHSLPVSDGCFGAMKTGP